MTAMDITIHQTFLPHDDPAASLAFYRDTLGFEVRNDVEYGGMHWDTGRPPPQPPPPTVLYPPTPAPRITSHRPRTPLQPTGHGTPHHTNRPTPPPHAA